MKYRILDFFRSTPVIIVGILLLMGGLYAFVHSHRNEPPAPVMQTAPQLPLVKGDDGSLKQAPVTEVNPSFTLWRPLAVLSKKPEPVVESKPVPAEPRPKLIHDYSQLQNVPAKGVMVSKPDVAGIPFGRVVPCRLLQTVHCGSAAVPVIAELLQPLRDANGRDWIPKGTRIHGTMQAGSLPGRVESAGEWILVLPGQKLLETKASLQDRDFDPSTGSYGIKDGMAGIEGKVVQSRKTNWKQTVVKEGTAIAAEATQDRMRTALGEVELGSARNAVLKGISSLVAGSLPKENQTTTDEYVELTAGREFYLYFNDKGQSQPEAKATDIETILQERARLMESLRQKSGRATP